MDKTERHADLLQAAKEVFAKKGFHDTAVSDIAERAGVAKGTFYLYFDDKESIFMALIDELFAMIVKTFTVVSPESVKSVEQMKSLVRNSAMGYAKLFADNRDLAKIFLKEGVAIGGIIEKRRSDRYRALVETSMAFLKHGMEKGFLRPIDPIAASGLVSALPVRMDEQKRKALA